MSRVGPVGPGQGLSKSLTSVAPHLVRSTVATPYTKGGKLVVGTPPILPRNVSRGTSDKMVHNLLGSQMASLGHNQSSCFGSTTTFNESASSNQSNSNGFIRLKFNEGQTICGVPCQSLECVVNVKGKENGVSVISRAAQVRQFGEFVDTHVVSGRCLEIFVRNRLTGSLVGGAVNITQETLASKCLSAPKKKKEFPLMLDKGGELRVTVKYFSEKEEKSSSSARRKSRQTETNANTGILPSPNSTSGVTVVDQFHNPQQWSRKQTSQLQFRELDGGNGLSQSLNLTSTGSTPGGSISGSPHHNRSNLSSSRQQHQQMMSNSGSFPKSATITSQDFFMDNLSSNSLECSSNNSPTLQSSHAPNQKCSSKQTTSTQSNNSNSPLLLSQFRTISQSQHSSSKDQSVSPSHLSNSYTNHGTPLQSGNIFMNSSCNSSNTNTISSLAANEVIQSRRFAFKEKKMHSVNGHEFVSHFFKNLTFCSFCSDFLWGLLSHQGYRCVQCTLVVHKKCHFKVLTQCPGSLHNTPTAQALVERFHINVPHQFTSTSKSSQLLLSLQFCEHCGQMIFPVCHSAVKCGVCGFVCHKKCAAFTANICGVDQKSIARALQAIDTDKQEKLERALRNESDGGGDNYSTSDYSEFHPNYVGLYSTIPALMPNNQSPHPYSMSSNDPTQSISPHFTGAGHSLNLWYNMGLTPVPGRHTDSGFGSDNTSYVPMDPPLLTPPNRNLNSSESPYEDMYAPPSCCSSGSASNSPDLNSLSPKKKQSLGSVYEQMWLTTAGKPVFVNKNIKIPDSFTNDNKICYDENVNITTDQTTGGNSGLSLNCFHMRTLIGRGSFGKVVLCEHTESGEPVAIKILKKHSVLMDDDKDAVFLERDVLHLTAYHPFFTHLIATFQSETCLFFVMEYIQGGDMMFHMAQNRKLAEPVARFLSAEVVLALQFLHQHNVIYRDLKLDNVLIDSQGHVRLTDFGMCRKLKHSEDFATTLCGTPDYMAPEIVATRAPRYTTSVDWWALGVLLFEMVCGNTPFRAPNNNDKTRHEMIINGKVSHYPHHMSAHCKSAIKGFLTVSVLERLGCSGDPKVHPFFTQIDFEMLERKQVQPPHKFHLQSNSAGGKFDTCNFEDQFTREKVSVTPVNEEDVPDEQHQKLFRNFSFLYSTS